MSVRVLFFATLRDAVGQREIVLEMDADHTVSDVRDELVRRFPDARAYIQAALCAVNQEFAPAATIISDGDEVAFFPPVSGGSSQRPEIFRLPTEPIDHDEIISAVTTPEVGAVVMFTGIVRGKTSRPGHPAETTDLYYEAYHSMALGKMQQVAAEIRARWPMVIGIACVQRLGRLRVGENTVLIACSAAHRDDGCFEAARYGIDRLKEIVPVWKQEIGPERSVWITGDHDPTGAGDG